jgi:hypothetical protein
MMEKSRQVLGTAPTTSEYNKVLQVELMILLSTSILCFMYEDYEDWVSSPRNLIESEAKYESHRNKSLLEFEIPDSNTLLPESLNSAYNSWTKLRFETIFMKLIA